MDGAQSNLRISLVAIAIMLVLYVVIMFSYGLIVGPRSLPANPDCERLAQPHPLCMSSDGQ
jgi:hypothetical protein